MRQFLGLIFLLTGIYFLGRNIIFSTTYAPFLWRNLPATGSVLSIMAGTGALVFFPKALGKIGWILLALGIVLVFLSGGVMLRPTSLWSFFVAFLSMTIGYKLLVERRFRF